jgi:chaperonin GroEL (HSP60 family)
MFCKILVMAAQSIANIVKSSLGPLGLDKMLVDNIGVRFALISHPQY